MIPTFQLPRLNSTDLILFIHVVLLVFVQIVFFSFNFIPEVQNFKKLLIKRTILFLPEVFFRVPVLHKIFEIILIAILSQVCNWCITLLLFMIKNILFYKRNKIERGYKIDKPFSDKEDVIAFSDGTVKINTKVNKENIKTRLQSTIVYKKRKKAKNENFLRKPYQIRMKIKLLYVLLQKNFRKNISRKINNRKMDCNCIRDDVILYQSPLDMLQLQLRLRQIQLQLRQKKLQAMRLMLDL